VFIFDFTRRLTSCDISLTPKNMELGNQLVFVALLAAVCALLPVVESRSVGSVKVRKDFSLKLCYIYIKYYLVSNSKAFWSTRDKYISLSTNKCSVQAIHGIPPKSVREEIGIFHLVPLRGSH